MRLVLSEYENARHRIIRLAQVAACLGEQLVGKVLELRDVKGVLYVTTAVQLDEADKAHVRQLWTHIGRESAHYVTFLTEDEAE